MKIVYISSSIIPSRTANSIHVMKMSQAFSKNGHELILLAPHDIKKYEPRVIDIFSFYGVEPSFEVRKLPWLGFRGKGYIYGSIAAYEVCQLKPDLVYGRNLIGCAFSLLAGFPVVFESHAPVSDNGRIEGWIFDWLSHHKNLKKFIVISQSLREHYISTFPHLAHKIDVAPDGADPVKCDEIPFLLPKKINRTKIGYVGHLYGGRGIENLVEIAKLCDWADFHFVGGSQSDLERCRKDFHKIKNCYFHGFVSPPDAEKLRISFDILVAPYQKSVMVSAGKLDTVRWMSPLKIFEYMASKKPIIASNLPALREILKHGYNALLCDPEDKSEWVKALLKIRDDVTLANNLAQNAYDDFLRLYTWSARAKNLISMVSIKKS